MAESSSRALLAPTGETGKPQPAWRGQRTKHKLPLVFFLFASISIGCIVASVAILITSHEDVVSTWLLRPSVVLAILSGIYSMILGALLTIGVAVVWWRSITHGTTLTNLHFTHAGASPKQLIPAFRAGGHARRVAISALVVYAAKLAIGPFLQRASRVEERPVTEDIKLSIQLAPEIREGYFGTGIGLPNEPIVAYRDTLFGFNITTADEDGYRCPPFGTCEATLQAAGLNFACTSSSETLDVLDPKSENSTIFSISMEMDYETGIPILYLDTKYISDMSGDCKATLTTQTCNMIPALMWYPVTISGSAIVINHTALIENPTIVSNSTHVGDEQTDNSTVPTGTLKGIQETFQLVWNSSATLSRVDDQTTYNPDLNSAAPFWADMFYNQATSPEFPDFVIQHCPTIWISPRNFVLSTIFGFMFRSAQEVALTDDTHMLDFQAAYKHTQIWYITDFGWLAAAIIAMVLGNCAALSLMWGWWQLDRYVSLSPLETGKALGAPILMSAGPETEATAIVEKVGHERVANDGDELVWNGTVYATGAVGSLRGGSSGEMGLSALGEMDAGSIHNSMRGRGHRRGMSSVSDASPSQPRPSFEHSLGVTTRRPYEDEDELDIGQYGRPRSRSRGSDTSPLMPMPLTVRPGDGGSPQLPPIPMMDSIRMEPLSPSGRPRRGSRSAIDTRGVGRRPLSNIAEANSPIP